MVDLKNDGEKNIANNGCIISGNCIVVDKVNILLRDKIENATDRLGDRLHKAIKSKRLSAYDLEKRIGISRFLICEYLDNKTEPTLKNATLLADHLGVSLDWLVKGESNKSNSEFFIHLEKRIKDLERLVKAKEELINMLKQ